jgi:hypothetical protein
VGAAPNLFTIPLPPSSQTWWIQSRRIKTNIAQEERESLADKKNGAGDRVRLRLLIHRFAGTRKEGGWKSQSNFFRFFYFFFFFLLGSSFCDPAHSPISPHLAFYFPCWFLFFPSPLRSILTMGFCFHRPLFFSALYFFHLFFPRNLRPRGPSSFQVLTWGDEQERSRGASTQVVIKSCQADNDGASNGTMLRSSPDIGHSSRYSRERKRVSLWEKTLTSAVAVTFAGSEETFDFLFIIKLGEMLFTR